MKIRLASEIQIDSIVDGEGIRAVIWTQGCSHNCDSCHNPNTHDFKGGFLKDIEDLKKELENIKDQDGITLSGGDPFFQPLECASLAKHAKKLNLNVWAYTGFLYEDLIKNEKTKELLKNIDILIDGKFDLSKKSYTAKFRGSTNQRIIDVKESMKQNKVIDLSYKYDSEDIKEKKKEYIYI